jgi:hypothetical protein
VGVGCCVRTGGRAPFALDEGTPVRTILVLSTRGSVVSVFVRALPGPFRLTSAVLSYASRLSPTAPRVLPPGACAVTHTSSTGV